MDLLSPAWQCPRIAPSLATGALLTKLGNGRLSEWDCKHYLLAETIKKPFRPARVALATSEETSGDCVAAAAALEAPRWHGAWADCPVDHLPVTLTTFSSLD